MSYDSPLHKGASELLWQVYSPACEPHHDVFIPPFEVVALILLAQFNLLLCGRVGPPFVNEMLELWFQCLLSEEPFVISLLCRMISDPWVER